MKISHPGKAYLATRLPSTATRDPAIIGLCEGGVPTQSTSPVPKDDLQLEIAHLLLIDIVGYSKLLVNEQIESVQELNRIVRNTEAFRTAETAGKLIRVPTGDGMALLFFQSPEQPVRCALEIAESLKGNSNICVRMGIHSGPVNQVRDVNDSLNVAGAGINIAQRVMDCGDAGHILLSKHVADDLAQYRTWRPHLEDFGECEVKHGLRLHIVNLCKEGLGNPLLPEKFRRRHRWRQGGRASIKPLNSTRSPISLLVIVVLITAGTLAISLSLFLRRSISSQLPEVTSVGAIPVKSIAVLPFENLSDDRENTYLADGVQDEILTDLSRVADLKVISRTSAQQYKSDRPRNLREIARELGVAHIVEGTVQRTGDRVRVSAQLIDARTDIHLWADHYDRRLQDVFAIESELAEQIVAKLKAKLSPEEKSAIEERPTSDLTAYDLYVRARALLADVSDAVHAKTKLPEAIELLRQAVSRDPNFLQAWCLLSKAHINIYKQGYDHTTSRLDMANDALQTALRLQPDASEAHLALADYYFHGYRDYENARRELATAKRRLPNDSEVLAYTGYINRRQGNWEEASRNLEGATNLDPRNIYILQQLALMYLSQRHYEDAIRTWRHLLTVVPEDPLTRISLALIPLDWRADIKPYQTTLSAILTENPSVAPDVDLPIYALCERTPTAANRILSSYPRDGVSYNGVKFPHAYWEGIVAHFQNETARSETAFNAARVEVEKLVRSQPNFAAAVSLLGMIDAGLGRKEQALREGRRACELLPISKDAIDGPALAINLAQIYAWTGEKDLAIEQLAVVERVPNELSYGLLRLHPHWDSLRGDPRFESIVAALGPKP